MSSRRNAVAGFARCSRVTPLIKPDRHRISLALPRGRACLNVTREDARKVALIGEPRQQCNFSQRHPCIEHKLLRALYSLLQQPLVRSASDRLFERLTEVTR